MCLCVYLNMVLALVGVLGIYFWYVRVDKNQVHVAHILDIARKFRPILLGQKQDFNTDFVKEIEDGLIDYTVDNSIQKSIANFLAKTVGLTGDEAQLKTASADSTALSGNPLFFVRNKQSTLNLVVKVFNKPFAISGNFIKELSGFQIVSTIKNGKHFNLITAKAIGKCIIDGKAYGLLAISPVPGINMYDLVEDMYKLRHGSEQRKEALARAQKAFKKLGAALAEFHQVRAIHNVTLHRAITKRARNHLARTVTQLRRGGYGIDPGELEEYFDYLVNQIEHAKTTRSFVHGDAHLANFMYDNKSDTLSLVDFKAMYRIADQEGNPIWHAAFDFMNILDAIAINKKFGLTDKEIGVLEDSFVAGYEHTFTDTEKAFFALACRLRIVNWFLRMEKDRPEIFIDEKMKIVSRYRLEELKKSLAQFKKRQ